MFFTIDGALQRIQWSDSGADVNDELTFHISPKDIIFLEPRCAGDQS
ncbi:hypothetical protein MNBD_ALPHA12-2185 [hydrothermal vent metagenome]|uniref:Uncharacterized protein n=1 Tax=hydrothermal vent metagenome TaxID=652676 RepID=A0A3B0TN92_9ZZZZ